MKAHKIHVSHFEFLSLEQLVIDQEIGEHATATVSGYIDDDNVDDYKWNVLEHIWVTITAEDEAGGRQVLMAGVIAGFSFDSQPHAVLMTLVLKSGTYLMDGTDHFRSYQNGGVTYLEMLESITAPYGNGGVKGRDCLETEPCGFLLQYRESDWEFIKRVASRFGLGVTPAATYEGIYYYVGNADYETYHLLESAKLSVSKRVGAFMKQGANGLGSSFEQDYMEYGVTEQEIYNLWDELRLGNEGGCVCRIHSEYEKGELLHSYTLRPLGGMTAMPIINPLLHGCSFLAAVKEVARDLVKVVLEDDENSGQATTRWFPYSTGYSSPDGPGWYCMPEIGDQVRLQIPGDSEGEGYVISSVHKKTDAARQNPDHKSFKTKYGKELLFTPTSLEMTNHQGMSIKITDGEGISIVSSRDVSITAEGNVTLSSEDASVVIAGSESVDVKQGGAGLHMEDDVSFTGGKFRIQ